MRVNVSTGMHVRHARKDFLGGNWAVGLGFVGVFSRCPHDLARSRSPDDIRRIHGD